jgi:hypothetical protein
MNKKMIFILLIIGVLIVLCFCLIIGALVAYRYKLQSSTTPSPENNVQIIVITSSPTALATVQGNTQNTSEAYDYATEVGNQLITCGDDIGDFNTLAVQLNENINLIFDQQYIDQMNESIDQIELTCTNIAKDENVPAQYADANEQLKLADESMALFVEYMHIGMEEMDVESITQALQNLASASAYYQQAKLLLKD